MPVAVTSKILIFIEMLEIQFSSKNIPGSVG